MTVREVVKQGKHSARKPPKLIIILICKTSSAMRKLKSSKAEKLKAKAIKLKILPVESELYLPVS